MTKDQINKAVAEGKTVYGSGGKKFKPAPKAVTRAATAEPVKQNRSSGSGQREISAQDKEG